MKKNGDARPVRPARDSDIDILRRAVRGKGVSNAEVYRNSYLSRSTITKLFETRPGKKRTQRPSHMTMRGAALAIGKRYDLVDDE